MGGEKGLGRPGMTLIEVMVAMAVTGVLFMVVFQTIHSATKHLDFELIVNDQQRVTRAAIDGMMAEMRKMYAPVASFDTQKPVLTPPYPLCDTINNKELRDTNNNVRFDAVRFWIPYFHHLPVKLAGVSFFGQSQPAPPDPPPFEVRLNEASGPLFLTLVPVQYYWEAVAGEWMDNGRVIRESLGRQTVICDRVPRNGFRVQKQDSRLALTLSRMDDTPIHTDQETRFTTTVIYVTYYLQNFEWPFSIPVAPETRKGGVKLAVAP